MTKAAMTELEQQIEKVRREGYAAGYRAAMQVIFDAASRPARKAGSAPAAPRPSANGRAQRGTNALIIEEILKAMAPSPVRPAEIRKALQDNGVAISFASIRNALGQLEARNAAEQVGDSKSWRHRGGTA